MDRILILLRHYHFFLSFSSSCSFFSIVQGLACFCDIIAMKKKKKTKAELEALEDP